MSDTLDSLIHNGALRFLHQIDFDRHSISHGIADRTYWAWKIRDYANGTWQGGVSGLLDAQDLLGLSKAEIRSIVSALLQGTEKIQRPDGSFEESYPLESSYAVTGLVLFNWMYAVLVHRDCFETRSIEQLSKVCSKAVSFLSNTPETHGIIANHVATTVLALRLARRFLQRTDNETALTELMSLQHKEEGWFPEYDGADPGYQLLFNHYFIAAHIACPLDERFMAGVSRATDFSANFCFENGDYAGEIGARGTAIVYPSGFFKQRSLQASIESHLKSWVETAHAKSRSSVNPVTVDDGNFVPVFNSWALYRRLIKFAKVERGEWPVTSNVLLNDAKLCIARRPQVTMVLSLHNGAYRRLVKQSDNNWIDESVVARTNSSLSTQLGSAKVIKNGMDEIIIELRAAKRLQTYNSQYSAIALRLMAIALYAFPRLHRLVKRLLVYYVMKRKGSTQFTGLSLSLDLSSESLPINTSGPVHEWKSSPYGFHRHMASANSFREAAL